MTSTLSIQTRTSADVRDIEHASLVDAAASGDPEACAVCPHPRPDHDAIATRFCSATGDGAITRGCVCQA